MLLEGVKISSSLKNILLAHCIRKNRLPWYQKRFGKVPVEILERRTHTAVVNKFKKETGEPASLDWNVQGDPLSIVAEAKKKRAEEEAKYQNRLETLEKMFLGEMPPEQLDQMRQNQRLLADKRKKKTQLPDADEIQMEKEELKKKKLKKKKLLQKRDSGSDSIYKKKTGPSSKRSSKSKKETTKSKSEPKREGGFSFRNE
eukprot:TRINITY_DN1365_c0_g1_i1.p2 TRINITY_DN1365_c0_g1~~TRINITY_DN1365_c0_g1_i1.p2  ORF type:complete len:201 (-),score=65.86 TRINITY_DN1365_c0_g1_i1:84-686(-)